MQSLFSRFRKAPSSLSAARPHSVAITHAIWMYSGAPCIPPGEQGSQHFVRQNEAHRRANGRRYAIRKGLRLNGEATVPGHQPGCRCSYRSVIPALHG